MVATERESYRRRLRATLVSQGAAYGFTLTVWGAGGLAVARYGPFSPPRVFLFVVGVLVMYAVLLLILYHPRERPTSLSEIPHTVLAFLDLVSVPTALVVAYLAYHVIPWPLVGFPAGSFLSTLVYNLLLAAQVLIFVPREMREEQ